MDVFMPMYNQTSHLFHNDGNWQFTKILLGAGCPDRPWVLGGL